MMHYHYLALFVLSVSAFFAAPDAFKSSATENATRLLYANINCTRPARSSVTQDQGTDTGIDIAPTITRGGFTFNASFPGKYTRIKRGSASSFDVIKDSHCTVPAGLPLNRSTYIVYGPGYIFIGTIRLGGPWLSVKLVQ